MTLAYLTVIGNKQGQFKAEGVPVQHKASIPVLAFVMELASARGAAAGPVTGKRQYQPVTVVKEWGAASPQGLAACATNEVLSTVKIEFSKTKPTGDENTFQTVTLTNATLSDVRRFYRGSGGRRGTRAQQQGAHGTRTVVVHLPEN